MSNIHVLTFQMKCYLLQNIINSYKLESLDFGVSPITKSRSTTTLQVCKNMIIFFVVGSTEAFSAHPGVQIFEKDT